MEYGGSFKIDRRLCETIDNKYLQIQIERSDKRFYITITFLCKFELCQWERKNAKGKVHTKNFSWRSLSHILSRTFKIWISVIAYDAVN